MAIHRKDEGLGAGSEDRQLADAYRNLEPDVALLRGATALLGLAVKATISSSDDEFLEGAGLKADKLPGWSIYALTPERAEALHHALNHIHDVSKELERSYFAGLEAIEVSA